MTRKSRARHTLSTNLRFDEKENVDTLEKIKTDRNTAVSNSGQRNVFETANVSVLAVPLVPSLALEPMTLYGTHVKEILTVFAESVPERHVDRFEVVGQLLLGPADLRAKVAPRHAHQDHVGMIVI